MDTPMPSGSNGLQQPEEAEGSVTNTTPPTRLRSFFRLVITLILLIAGLILAIGGFQLLSLGGSLYYLAAGSAYVIGAILLFFRLRISAYWAILTFIGTFVWSLYDSPSLTYWDLVPRLGIPALLMLLTLWCAAYLPKVSKIWRSIQLGISLLTFIALGATFGASFYPHDQLRAAGKIPDLSLLPDQNSNWTSDGRDADGTRFSPSTQITTKNIQHLKVAWVYHSGRSLTENHAGMDENTPLQVGDTLYACTPEHSVTAIKGDTGKPLWRYNPHSAISPQDRCRSVAYYDIAQDQSLSPEQKAAYSSKECRRRILVTTADGHLIALDAASGKPCSHFGQNGILPLQDTSLEANPSENPPHQEALYSPSASPVVAGHLVILGGWKYSQGSRMPTGSVRAYDAITGQQAWAWNIGDNSSSRTNAHAPVPISKAPELKYTLTTPSVWATPTYDSAEHLIFVPTGSTPHGYIGNASSDTHDQYSTAIVALDANTGQVRWKYQTVHHDLWGYDLPSQPVLTYVNNDQGQSVQALIQTTRTGNIFVLDPVTGQPITEVDEQQVPDAPHANGIALASTQPYSTGMPRIGATTLNENSMWGLTPFDQMACRIQYKQSSYQGDFTPPTASRPYIEYPGIYGGMNWGGISVDPAHRLMFVNDIREATQLQLIQHKSKDQKDNGIERVLARYLQSPLGVPCIAPPFGTLSAINLNTHKLVWQAPMGSVQDSGLLGIKTHLNIPVGMPTSGGPTATAGGLVFFAGSRDYYLRAIDEKSGRVVWKARLPEGATAAPLVYTSPATGKEYVVISAGGAPRSAQNGDAIIAYALPDHSAN